MTLNYHALGSWLILLAAILLLTPLSVNSSIVLGIAGTLLWSSADRNREDRLLATSIGVLFIAFLLPLPLPLSTPTPLRLALIVGWWTLVASLVSAAAARRL